MITCTRRLTFCAAHRLLGHTGPCADLHGHNYTVEITAAGPVDAEGRVVDFAEIKHRIGRWLRENWDHAFIHNWADPLAATVPGKKFAFRGNPTAENMAAFLLDVVAPAFLRPALLRGVNITHVRVWETEDCYADAW